MKLRIYGTPMCITCKVLDAEIEKAKKNGLEIDYKYITDGRTQFIAEKHQVSSVPIVLINDELIEDNSKENILSLIRAK